MVIDKDTSLFVSVSARPGSLGASVYNALFASYGINAVYLPRLAPASGAELVQALRTLGISGCSVSMPLKESVVPYLDELSRDAQQLGSVNTIVRKEQRLCGYNTDWQGAVFALEQFAIQRPGAQALIYGAGGVTPAIVTALRSLGIKDITLYSRRAQAAEARINALGLSALTPASKAFDLVVNATPSEPDEQLQRFIRGSHTFFDLSPSLTDTAAIAFARGAGMHVIPGLEMFIGQVCIQAELYTGIRPTQEKVRAILKPAS